MRAIAALMAYYNHKTQAAVLVMKFGYDRNADDLKQAEPLLAASVDDFARLTELTDKAYRNAAGMQTSQRQIPVRGGPGIVGGDGLETDGSVLYNVRGSGPYEVSVLRLAPTATGWSAKWVGARTDDTLDIPSTATLAGGWLWAVNARFGVASPFMIRLARLTGSHSRLGCKTVVCR